MDKNKIKLVLFDIDDTLCKTAGTKEKVFRNLYNSQKSLQEVSSSKFLESVSKARGNYFNKLKHDGFNTYSRIEFWFQLFKDLKIMPTIKEISMLARDYWKYSYEYIQPYPGLISTLDQIKEKKYTLGTLTGGDFYSKSKKLIKLGIDKHFDYNFTTELVQKPKTDGKLYKYVIEYLNLDAKSVLMIGDKPSEDITPANKVGMITVQVTMRGDLEVKTGKYSKPDFIISNLDAIVGILNQLEKNN